ncbi:MAG: membrane or secreted protein [Flavobacteriales bacterium]|jgi:hypothetical protein|nr:membrane or secreted protein [Flavobacteriales bacterium]|tara:strand:- start:42696 stop:42899 length:204 start_codon:yes stop_codon:yes gene_type:complete
MELILLTIGFLALAFAGIAIKILVKKNGEFEGTCASKNPVLNQNNEPCSLCGAQPGDQCDGDNQEAA